MKSHQLTKKLELNIFTSAADKASANEPNKSEPIPAMSPTLSPTLSAMQAGLCGSSSGKSSSN